MGSPDYAAVLDLVHDASPADFASLLLRALEPLEASEMALYLADFQGVVLQPVPIGASLHSGVDDAEVATSVAGRVYRTGETVISAHEDGCRVWVPVVERGERTGVLALTVREAGDATVADCVRLGRFAGLLVRSFARSTDVMHLRRRRRSMTLAAGMQWDLLPPLTVRCAQAMACGRLEPAYEIAGDAFDYVINDQHLHAAVFDGMGHGVESTLMTTLAVGAYRHARRGGEALDQMHEMVDDVVAAQYRGQAFVTGAFARIHLETGVLEWTNAGHPAPLLLRGHHVVKELSCAPSLPLGLGGGCRDLAVEALEPGDCVLVFTDGVVEGRSHDGQEFGVERLIDAWERYDASDLPADEVLRRLVEEVTTYSAGKLRDDASLMLLCWNGSSPARAAQP